MSRNPPPSMIYLDHAGGALVDLDIAQRYADYCRQYPLNPHGGTQQAEVCRRAALTASRRLLACLHADEVDAHIVWTSGGTESLNLAIRGCNHPAGRFDAIAVDAAAHPAMLESARERAAREQLPLHFLKPGERWENLPPRTLACICQVNNETGAILSPEVVRRQLSPEALLVMDAAQSFGRLPLDWRTCGADFLALSARKLGGPAACGALVMRKSSSLQPLILGGGQQAGLRSGTLDVIGAAMFADVAQKACAELIANAQHIEHLAAHLWNGLQKLPYDVERLSPHDAFPGIASLAIPGYEGAVIKRLLAQLHSIVIGTGSACSAEAGHTSHVLKAMNIPEKLARSALRVSFCADNTCSDIDAFLEALSQTLKDY